MAALTPGCTYTWLHRFVPEMNRRYGRPTFYMAPIN